jgi:hypothetical protein
MAIHELGYGQVEAIGGLFSAYDEQLLNTLRQEGYQRLGVVSLILNRNFEVLLLEHAESEKNRAGMWGPLGETALAQPTEEGWTAESSMETLARGYKEELGHELPFNEVRYAPDMPYFTFSWPVGINDTTANAFAVCPIIVVDEQLASRIESASKTPEVTSARFAGSELATEDPAFSLVSLRPGVVAWLLEAGECINSVRDADLKPLPLPVNRFDYSVPSQDAIFSNMYPDV